MDTSFCFASWSNYLLATAKVAHITEMIFIHIILHSPIHIYDFHIFITLSAELFTSTERVLTQRSIFTPQRAIVVPKSLGKTESSVVCSSLLPDTSKLESEAEEFLPGAHHFCWMHREKTISSPDEGRFDRYLHTSHLFANRQIEQPKTY